MDAILTEKAGDVLPLLAQAVGGAAFKPYFKEFLPLLTRKTVLRITINASKYICLVRFSSCSNQC